MPAHDYAGRPGNSIKNLEKDCLFYYSYAGEHFYTRLGTFPEFQQRIYQVEIIKNEKYGWIIEVGDWQKDLKGKESFTVVYKNNKERLNKKILNKEFQPSITKKKINWIATFVHDKKQRELLKESMLPATKKQIHSIITFVPEKEGHNLIEIFLSENIDLNKYQKIKKKIPFFDINVFLKEVQNNTYELKPDLYEKSLFDDYLKKGIIK